jgi:hypothetical protein
MSEKSFMQRVISLQTRLKAPKSQYNKFGGYNYRKCEDILEGAKDLLDELDLSIVITDEVVMVGERYYVKATAMLIDALDPVNQLDSVGFSREELDKKGMDQSQITGASSSYARKYALNGLLMVDDSVDSDGTNDHGKKPTESSKPERTTTKSTPKDSGSSSIMDSAVNYIKTQKDKQKAYEAITKKYGDQLSEAQKNGLKKFVR